MYRVKVIGDTLTFHGTRMVLTINGRGPVNLDKMDPQSLMTFWHMTYIGGWAPARFLFPDRPKGYIGVVRALGSYASNRATAIGCSEDGDTRGAAVYHGIADIIYRRDIPEWARWK